MAKKEFSCDLKEVIEVLEEKDGSNWVTALIKVSWNGGDPRLELRSLDLSTVDSDKIRFGNGIKLSDDLLTRLIYKVIKMGYGDEKKIKKLLKKRNESIFGEYDDDIDIEEYTDDNGNINFNFDLDNNDKKMKTIKVRKLK